MWIHFLSLSGLHQSISASVPPPHFLTFLLCSSFGSPFTCAHVTIVFCHHCSVLLSFNQPICHSSPLLYNCLSFHPRQQRERVFMETYQRQSHAAHQQLEERTESRKKGVMKGGGRLEGRNNPAANHTSSCGPANRLPRLAGGQRAAQLPENR